MTIRVLDTFTRADNTSTMGSTESGTAGPLAWAVLGTGVYGINSNQAYPFTPVASDKIVVDTGVANGTFAYTVQGAAILYSGLVCRLTDINNCWLVTYDGTNTYLNRLNASVNVVMGTYVGMPVAGDVVAMVCSGNTIAVTINGATVIAAITDSFNNTATKAGLTLAAGSAAVRWDTFTVTVAGGADHIGIFRQPANAASGMPLDFPPIFGALNPDGTLDQTYGGTCTLTGIGGTVSGTTSLAFTNGVVYFSNVITNGTSPMTISAAAPGLTSAVTSSITPVLPQFDFDAFLRGSLIELPRVVPDDSYFSVSSAVTVGPVGRNYTTIQAALDALIAADSTLNREIILDNNNTYSDFIFRTRAPGMGKIRIRGVTNPPDDVKIIPGSPSQLAMPQLLSSNTFSAIMCEARTHDIYLDGIWVQFQQAANDSIEYFSAMYLAPIDSLAAGVGTVSCTNGLATFSNTQGGITDMGAGARLFANGTFYRVIYVFSGTSMLLDNVLGVAPTFASTAVTSWDVTHTIPRLPYNLGLNRIFIAGTPTSRLRKGVIIGGGSFYIKNSVIQDVHDFYPTTVTNGVGTLSSTADAVTFTNNQGIVINNTVKIKVGGTLYQVSAYDGSTHCTLAGLGTVGSGTTFQVWPVYAHVPGGTYIGGVGHVGNGNGDTNAIGSSYGTGPFLFKNCDFYAAGEVSLIGGADPMPRDLLPSDITILQCYFIKPLAWKGLYPAKNTFELKSTRRLSMNGFVLDGSWQSGQNGDALVCSSAANGNFMPWAVVEHVSIKNGVIRNAQSVGTFSAANTPNIVAMNKVVVWNVLAANIDGVDAFDGNMIHFGILMAQSFPTAQLKDVIFRHVTFVSPDGNNSFALSLDDTSGGANAEVNCEFGDSIVYADSYGIIGSPGHVGKSGTDLYLEDASNITFIAPVGSYAYQAGVPAGVPFPAGGLFPATVAAVGFVDPTIRTTWSTAPILTLLRALTLLPTSPSYHTATDGKDRGADTGAIISALGLLNPVSGGFDSDKAYQRTLEVKMSVNSAAQTIAVTGVNYYRSDAELSANLPFPIIAHGSESGTPLGTAKASPYDIYIGEALPPPTRIRITSVINA